MRGSTLGSGLVVRRSLLAILATLAVALVAGAAPAAAATHTRHFDYPVSMSPYEVRQQMSLAHTPEVDGFITRMSVNVVDGDGKPVPIKRLMLHHIVFAALGKQNRMCQSFLGFDSRRSAYGNAELFYGAGEERNVLQLPPGYGYQIQKKDKYWGMIWMLMNHRGKTDHAFIRYTVTWDDAKDLTPVHPYWLDVRNCQADPVFDVPGGGRKNSTFKQTYDYTMPESGRIVAGGGHVHGGAQNLTVSEPDCANRKVLVSKPAWGTRANPFYHVRPILHEPGPISMSGMLSEKGYPIHQGERIRLTANYDDQRPHTRVMGISMVYVAPDETVGKCAPKPDDVVSIQPAELRHEPYRTHTPRFVVPLTGLDANGNAVSIKRPPGKTVAAASGTKIGVEDFFFKRPNLAVKPGAVLKWTFGTPTIHNVTLANGPRGFSSPNLNTDPGAPRTFSFKFRKSGTYRIFCALHPVTMSETVTVHKHSG
jgi:plastocyanin